ncbi:unnamed protein product [Peniophora sp. CBMAI 1063]|nr:unnamed protein product [Peniophora sp. CBMAI 1063]
MSLTRFPRASAPLLRAAPLQLRRTYATELPRPPPSTPPPAETFSGASKPREYYARPAPRDLPPYRPAWPMLLLAGAAGIGVWVLFFQYTSNTERMHSSIVQRILTILRNDPEVRDTLGDAIRFEPTWWLNGDPWVSGSIAMMKGRNDLSFRVKGHKGAGTVYFTDIRKRGEPWTTLRFKIIADNGEVIQLTFD